MDIGAWEISAALVKALTYAATLGAAGLALFHVYALPRGLQQQALAGPLAGLCAAAVAFSLFRMALLAAALGGVAGIHDLSLLRRMLHTGEGAALLARLCGIGLLGAGAFRARPVRGLLLAGALLSAMSFALTGHVSAKHHALGALLAVHLACAAFWVGALWPMSRLLRDTPGAEAAPVIARFSRLALALVPLLLLAGLALATALLGSLQALWMSAYGRWLCLKLLLVALLLALAALNRLRLTPRLGQGAGAGALRLAIHVEMLVAGGVLAATAALTTFVGPGA